MLTLDYWKYADKIEVGDYVFDKDGKITQVKLVQRYFAEDCYEVILDDHLSIKGDKHLAFNVENETYRKQLDKYKMVRRVFLRPLKQIKVQEFLTGSLKGRGNRTEFSIPTTKPLEFPHQFLGVPPFIFGFWYFNRKMHKNFIAHHGNKETIFQKFKDHGYQIQELHVVNNHQYFYEVPNIEQQMLPNVPTRIPNNYLMGSIEERVELLSGIVHSKSKCYNAKTNWFRFCDKHLPTIQSIQGLVESLGNKSYVLYDRQRKNYTIFFNSKIKLTEQHKVKPVKVHYGRRYIKEINPIQSQMCVHIETENNNAILVGEGFIPVC